MTEALYLLDVNVLVALLDKNHVRHVAATRWFDTPGLQRAVCPFTEAGLLRYFTRPFPARMTIGEVSTMLARFSEETGYHYQPVAVDWRTLSRPFSKRLFGHNQITDACLLGLALHAALVLVTFDKAILHLAGEHAHRVLLLQ